MKRFVLKCSFGGTHGWGHVIRSSALAGVLKNRGWETCLWGEGDPGLLPADVGESFARFDANLETPAGLLCIDEMYTKQAVFDSLVSKWRELNPSAVVAGVDDMQRRSMAGFDLVLNTEIGLNDSSYRANKSLLGESFALLRGGFSTPAELKKLPSLSADRVPILVMIGGTDPYGYTSRVLEVLANSSRRSFVPIVVTNEPSKIEAVLGRFVESRVVGNLTSAELAAWMTFCEGAIVACGSSLYEVAAMNLPFVGLSIVDNQSATAKKVEANWRMPILYCEDGTLNQNQLASCIVDILGKGRGPYSIVDTKGAERAADELEVLCG